MEMILEFAWNFTTLVYAMKNSLNLDKL